MPIPSTPAAFFLASLVSLLKLVELANATPIVDPISTNATAEITRWIPPPMPSIDPPVVPIENKDEPPRGNQVFCAIV
ncbi:hypothetical protein TWF718_007135 [Orbilia javanica]|uniref:Uncharacterized protein n=1 Tax=Orbilia javanica TaxID=47235 RepID=A0AAN8RND3_9PEZI